MHGNRDNPWFRHDAATGGSGAIGGGLHCPSSHPINPNFNIQNPNSYPIFLNPETPNFFIGNPNLPPHLPHHLQFPPRQIPNFSFYNSNFLPLHHRLGDGFSPFPPQQLPNSTSEIDGARAQSYDRSPERVSSSSKMERIDLSENEKKRFSKVTEKSGPEKAPKRKDNLERIELAVEEARRGMVMARESVSSFKVSQAVLSVLKADSWRSLGVQMQDVSSLRRLMSLEGKINAFIHCFVGVRRITTLYDLEMAICQSESVDHFEDLELGPLLKHSLVLLYFPSNSGTTKAFKITSEEILSFLDNFVDAYKKNDVKIDEFLNFIAKKKLVARKEQLGVRIQSLGMYVSFIRDAQKQEGEMLKNFLSELQQKYHHLSSMKQQDDHSRPFSQHVDSYSFVHKDFCGKHVRFDSSSADDEDGDDVEYEDRKNDNSMNSSDHVSTCPYPSATEERKRLRLIGEKIVQSSPAGDNGKRDNVFGSSKKKRKAENFSPAVPTPSKLPKTDNAKQHVSETENAGDTEEVSSLNKDDLTVSDISLRKFISTWKYAVKELTMDEVLEHMFQYYYKSRGHEVPSRKKRERWLSTFPICGLVNIAIISMRCGMDSIYPKEIRQDRSTNEVSELKTIDVKPSDKHTPDDNQHTVLQRPIVTVEEIIRRVSMYFEHDIGLQNNGISGEKILGFYRKLHECELWLCQQFLVLDFKSLGCGEFLTVLEKHISQLPIQLEKFLTREIKEEFPLEVHMRESMLAVLVSQASNFSIPSEVITKQMVSALLMRQFPSLSFKIIENDSMENFLETIRNYKDNVLSKRVLFSTTLLGIEKSLACKDMCSSESLAAGNDTGEGTGVFKFVTSENALDVLLRAPLLFDLNSWCHWDLMFAPYLGSLIGWLMNEVNSKELLCLVTKEGKVIRIDPFATVDSFLEAALQGSAYHTAVQLLSLISLSGGKHVPLSLIKCYAQRSFEVIANNHLENTVISDERNSFLHHKVLHGPMELDVAANELAGDVQKLRTEKAGNVAARFLLDCLGYLPAEFRSFVADILLSALRSVIKNAPAKVLCACEQEEQRVMLHEAGLSLGILEWIDDYHLFCSASSSSSANESAPPLSSACTTIVESQSEKLHRADVSTTTTEDLCEHNEKSSEVCDTKSPEFCDTKCPEVCDTKSTEVCNKIADAKISGDSTGKVGIQKVSEVHDDRASVIESIRRDEFGLDSNLSDAECAMLEKQHARLGRALQCLSQELYSQDSHFILELVQNADDNAYPEHVEPTLTFILQRTGIFVLNNERGFSAENIRALCDVGRSTKKTCSGYIGKKGIGFKSVFRISDAPEIHSNGFHVKFDISKEQIGFVLPTVVPSCDIDALAAMLSGNDFQLENAEWNTCIALPFRSGLSEGTSVSNVEIMFSDLHPSLLLFLHRLQCIIYRNMLEDSLLVMRKKIVEENIIKVSCGENNMTWFVATEKLHAEKVRNDVQTTEIAIAFTLEELDEGNYRPRVSQQPVFAFLPLRAYGLKFILQGDFVLTSSREEVDESSPWNQWLLSEFPRLFVSAQKSFCMLPCFKENTGKAVGAFMQFVPLVGDVHGFFSCLPRTIISKLRMSNCLLVEGDSDEWVPPCRVLRGWNERARALLPDCFLHEHLGLGFLNKEIILVDSLSRALGIQDYGPKILVQVLSSLSQKENGLHSMGLSWLSSFLIELYLSSLHSSGKISLQFGLDADLLDRLRRIPFIPLSDGTFSSLDEGAIWLHYNSAAVDGGHGFEAFPQLYANLRTINHSLLSAAAAEESSTHADAAENLVKMLYSVGVQKLSAHEIIKVHILPAVSDERSRNRDKALMIEYLCFVMIHLQSGCNDCHLEREYIISELKHKAFISTNEGLKRSTEVPIHFGEEFGNCINIKKLTKSLDILWHEVDVTYVRHPASELHRCGLKKWREFFQEIGITDFVQVVPVEKSIADLWFSISKDMKGDINMFSLAVASADWESHELVRLLSLLSKSGDRESCKYLLEVLDMLWDDCFGDKTAVLCSSAASGDIISFKSSFMRNICDIQWVASSVDNMIRSPFGLFYDCDDVRSILGKAAPYAVPKVRSVKLLNDIGFKTKVTLGDALELLEVWEQSESPFKASISQMTRFYEFIWKEMANSKPKITETFRSTPAIFVPYETGSRHGDMVSGNFLALGEVCWRDSIGIMDQIRDIHSQCSSVIESLSGKTLCNIYPGLHVFFVDECGVPEMPSLRDYLKILSHLSRDVLPSCAAKVVFRVFLKWAEELKSGKSSEDICHLKEALTKSEFTVLPTERDKWVSLHCTFGLVCWCDDEKLKKRFSHKDNIEFISFGKLSDEEQELLQMKVSTLMHHLGIPSISEVVTREAKYEGLQDSSLKLSLVNWALAYAQRYMYSLHCDKYLQLKQTVYGQLKDLKIFVVEKLYYRNVIKQCGIKSKKRYNRNCLLQDDVLYATPELDSHSLYMELSRLFFDGMPDLHFANFLHIITTMAESGLNEEQTESFVLNNQKVQKLPDDEPVWFLKSARKFNKQAGISSSWPPASWTNGPGFSNTPAMGSVSQPASAPRTCSIVDEKFDGSVGPEEQVPIEIEDAKLVFGDDDSVTVSRAVHQQYNPAFRPNYPSMKTASNPCNPNFSSDPHESALSDFSERDQLHTGTLASARAQQTGRLGEEIAFRYFANKYPDSVVQWANQDYETGLPYDIVIEEREGKKQYIEVKATVSMRKDWFNLSVREWQFAHEKGESYSIAHVLLGNKDAILTQHTNPVKLCQEGKLRLVILMPKQQNEFAVVS